ncbi:MAG: DNA polymerase III subunit epsilon [Bacteroidetes bacterium]|nr:DNA polymerase III subunit epsilon [Bacteroidota bacterium]MBU1371152.1 DNA polymerase III subunit epsilon [Bacteroidota bacterium]MBU1484705.1 DNA polymerase III subunit epsilon [Bacteroidota bacterium]MBU1760881.1 DNA polymerase III subunit epsilon [Bacteroidota bacterium]MBU2267545.1 DNA polymerase III subunit epsilon [Bacteroidota bacterium]
MKLNLKRPLAFFDLEATGINVASDRIVEISILKAMPDGSEEVKTLKINPIIPIPLETSLIHGIYDEDIKDAPKFKEVAKEIIDFLGDADLAGYNSNKFDIPMLMEEFLRVGINFDIDNRKFVDVQNIFHQMEQRTLKAAYKFYCGKDIINAHSAEADIKATYEVLLSQIEKYVGKDYEDRKGNISQPVKNDVEALHDFTNLNKPVDFAGRMVYDEDNQPLFNFGKHKGKTVFKVFDEEPSYYAWMMNGDFPLYTKNRLEKFWKQHREQKFENKQSAKAPELKTKPISTTNTKVDPPQQKQTPQQTQPKPKDNKPVDEDMLKMLAGKFKKL